MYLFVRSINKTISTIIKNSIIENSSFTFIHSYEFFFFDSKNDNFSSRISISTINEQISSIEKNDEKLNQSKQSNFQKFSIFDEFSNFEKKKKKISKKIQIFKNFRTTMFLLVWIQIWKKKIDNVDITNHQCFFWNIWFIDVKSFFFLIKNWVKRWKWKNKK